MDPQHQVERATALLELGRPVEAEATAREALGADPGSVEALTVLTRALAGQRRHAEAVAAGRAAVTADPEHADAFVALAWALVGDEQAEEAVAVARSSVALAPHGWATHHALGWALHRSDPPRNEEARDAAARALELEPGATAAHSVLGLALAGLGQRRAGRRVMREGLRISPDDPYLHNNLAKLDLDRGLRVGRTGRHLRAAAGGMPQEPVVHQNLDTLVLRFGVRLVWPTLLALFVLRAELQLGAPWWGRALTGAVHLTVLGLLVTWFARQVPRGLRHWARGVLSRLTLPLRAIASGLLLFGACVVVTAFAPDRVADLAQDAASVLMWVVAGIGVLAYVAHRWERSGPR
ncbi:tetratricopeptide (TPR) repeat protein [Nocardioides cavernae]|uniref:Tetratricopeptide (TPR) repeat protein n=1 Tax=Nocardioides cavernae TaxID=1921566 RepID=A0A7Y9H6I2_9ACTN|nr:tetratricopeptide repeat protein [Nocardioides cavernae]NYE38826.1 tetratricopeptide (TPR) repeat protein [Nocardioides cavernae]